MKKLFTLAAWLISFLSSFEQNVAINNTSVPPDASAMLDVSSSTKGLLVPRMTQVQRATISNPAKGLLVYQTDTDSGFYFNAGSAIAPNWIPLQSQLTGWSTKGNAGTTANNFLGTIDESPLRFRYHNLNAGMIDSISFNTGIGFRSFDSLTTGQHNSNFGYKTLITNSTGNRNTALGSNALRFNTTGTHNVAAGMQALVLNTTGNSNVAIGQNALGTNSDRSNLVAVGDSALYNNGFGASAAFHATANTAIGSKAMYGNQTGYRNTALGYTSLYGNNSGTNNTALGYSTMISNHVGNDNTAVGSNALYSNNSSHNTAVGSSALLNNTTFDNTGVGFWALTNSISGSMNTAVGSLAGYQLTTGFQNTAVGVMALGTNKKCESSTAVGYYALANDTSAGRNTAFGGFALMSNTRGDANTAVGTSSLISNTTGAANTAVGGQSLFYNLAGQSNAALGFNSLYQNTSGSFNTATGTASLSSNLTGNSNVANGYGSLGNNNAGNNNTAVGANAVGGNVNGSNNSGFGYRSLFNNTAGYSNVAIGTSALYTNIDRSNLVAVGDSALYNNGTSALNASEGTENSSVGSKSMYSNTTGSYNAALGFQSAYFNTSGFQNAAVGAYALWKNSTGHENTALGEEAASRLTTGSYNTSVGRATNSFNTTGDYNTALGYLAGLGPDGTLSNASSIGALSQVNCSNCMVLGSTQGVNGAPSDVKVGISTTTPGFPLNFADKLGDKISLYGSAGAHYGLGIQGFLMQIHTDQLASDIAFGYGSSGSFTENMRIKGTGNVGIGTISPTQKLQVIGNICATGSIASCSDIRYKTNLVPINNPLATVLSLQGVYYEWKTKDYPEMQFSHNRQIGFAAQEVEKVLPELVSTGSDGYKSVDYGKLTPVLVEAMKQQQQQIEDLKKAVEELKFVVAKLSATKK